MLQGVMLLPNTETLWAVNFCCQPNITLNSFPILFFNLCYLFYK